MKKIRKGVRRNWWQILLGLDYVANIRTKEIHRVESNCKCFKDFMKHNQKFVSEKSMHRLLQKGYNGCRHCMPECNTDKR